MIEVGINISKAKITIATIDSDGTGFANPFTMVHIQPEMVSYVTYLKGLGEPTAIFIEYMATTIIIPCLKIFKTWNFPSASSLHTR